MTDPALLTSITFQLGGIVNNAEVLNQTHTRITSLQYGMVGVRGDGSEPVFRPASLIQFAPSIAPGDQRGMPSVTLEPELFPAAKEVTAFLVFIYQVRFEDGSTWTANVPGIVELAGAQRSGRTSVQ